MGINLLDFISFNQFSLKHIPTESLNAFNQRTKPLPNKKHCHNKINRIKLKQYRIDAVILAMEGRGVIL